MTAAPLIHICGWPGSGKRTIARRLRDRIGARLIDNHLILDPASALFDRGTPERAALRERLRAVLYDAAVGLPPEAPLILTDALAQTDVHRALWQSTQRLAHARGAPLRPVLLQIDLQENLRRLTDPRRADWDKLTDPARLEDLRRDHALLQLPDAFVLDVTELSPDAAAAEIEAAIHG